MVIYLLMKHLKKFEQLNEKKWSKNVSTNWSPKEGIFTQSAEKIAAYLKRESDDLKQAMSRLNFYINRAGKKLNADDKSRLENAKKKLHNLYKVNENYPPGAEHDSRAPWNQKSPKEQRDKFEDVFIDEDNDEVPVVITYYYYELDNDINQYVTGFDWEFPKEKPKCNPEYIEEIVREILSNHLGKWHEFVD